MFMIRCCKTCAFYGGKSICNYMEPIKIPDDPESHYCVYHEYDVPENNIPKIIPCKALNDHILIYRVYNDEVKLPIQAMPIKDSASSSAVFCGTLSPMNVSKSYNVYHDGNMGRFAVRKDDLDEN